MDSFSVYNAGGGTTSPTPISKLGWVYFLQMRTLQSVDYSYYIRGLKGINLDANNNLTNKLFSMKLGYEETGYYDGNIGKQEWKSSLDGLTRSYAYSYDGANRILSGVFAGGKVGENYSLNSVVYDGNGNITSLSRNGFKSNSTFGLVDNLNYSYPNGSNKIQAVSDISNETASFTDVAGSTDYTYYPDGSLKSDANKGITLIEYNYLKLPKRIVKGSTTILYQYDASGKKLKETIGTNVTDYVGNLIYKNNGGGQPLLYQLVHDEGRIVDGQYEYNIKDHLGNLRVAFRDSSGIAKIVQSNSYGVWGEDLTTLSYLKSSWKADNFKFTGKEELPETGYTDFGARLYDKLVPRFITVDPLAEKYFEHSPFNYVLNNPIRFTDPDGRMVQQDPIKNAISKAIVSSQSQAIKANQAAERTKEAAKGILTVNAGVQLAGAGAGFKAGPLKGKAEVSLLNLDASINKNDQKAEFSLAKVSAELNLGKKISIGDAVSLTNASASSKDGYQENGGLDVKSISANKGIGSVNSDAAVGISGKLGNLSGGVDFSLDKIVETGSSLVNTITETGKTVVQLVGSFLSSVFTDNTNNSFGTDSSQGKGGTYIKANKK